MIGYQLSSCCCNNFPSPRTSCCRPIYSGCVGKTYEFKFRVSVKMYCPNFPPFHLGSNIVSGKYTCQNDPSIQHNIMNNNMETFEFTIRHTIDFPTDTAGLQDYLIPSPIPGSGIRFSNGFPWPEWDCPYPISNPCPSGPLAVGCGEYLGLLRSSQDCLPVVWTNLMHGLPEDACCGVRGPFTKCTFGELRSSCGGCYPTEPNPDMWAGCYSNYILKSIEPTYVSIGPYQTSGNFGQSIRCERTGGNSNLLHNKVPTITFIPNPSYPEQLDPNYEPKMVPIVRQFNFLCKGDHNYYHTNNETPDNIGNRYYARVELGFGYQSKFNCGTNTDNETIIETLNLPYFIHVSDGDIPGLPSPTYSNGLSLTLAYTRFSLDSDPMNSCIPTSSQNHILTDSISSDGTAVNISILDIEKPEIYADEYSLRSVYYTGNAKDGIYQYNLFGSNVIESYAPGSGSLGLNGPGWLDGAFGLESMYAIFCPSGLYPNDELYCQYCPSITNGNIPITINWSQFVKISETMQVTEV